MASAFISTVQHLRGNIHATREVGIEIANMVKASSLSRDNLRMKDSSKMVAITNTAKWLGQMEISMKDHGKKGEWKAAASSSIMKALC